MINMKKILSFLILLLAFIIPSKVFALTASISLECDSITKKVGETISCTLYGNSDAGISAVESAVIYSSDLTINNVSVNSSWQGTYEDESFLLYTDSNKAGKFEIAKINVTSSKAGKYTLYFEGTKFTDASFVRNEIANPNYFFTFISEEESKKEEEKTTPTIVDDDTKEQKEKEENSSQSDNKEETENPGTGAFMPIILISSLLIIGSITYIKVKNKKIYKL